MNIEKLEAVAKAATQGEWRACNDGRCPCATVWSKELDAPIAEGTHGPWGDFYPSLRIVGPSMDAKAEVFMDGMEYGSIDPEVGSANATHIAAFNPKAALALLAVVRAAERALTTAQQVVVDMGAQTVLIEWYTELENRCIEMRAALHALEELK